VDRENTVAYYYQVAETLKARIESQQYPPGELLPSDRDLARAFGVSNITIRRAMSLLVSQGLVVRRRGVGTRVLALEDSRIPLKITGNFKDWVDSALSRSQKLAVTVLGTETTACPQRVAKQLQRTPGSDIWRLQRVRSLKSEPISYYINYVPPGLLRDVSPMDFVKRRFIEVFQQKSGIAIVRIEQQVEATCADMDVAGVLEVDFGAPLFFITNIYSDSRGTPVEVTHMYFRGDRYIYKTITSIDDAS